MDRSNEFVTFLKNGKAAMMGNTDCKFHVVIGNESADLDSFVSAIVYAFYLSKRDLDAGVVYIPVVSIHADDLVLRTEIIALLNKLEISRGDIIFLNEVNFASLPVNKVTLVDHNNRAKHLKDLSSLVCKIIDHHEDSDEFDVGKNIKTVGSCATLVTEEIYYYCNSILSTNPIADLLLSAVLIDTYNLDLHSGRTTELDIFMGEILTNHTTEDPDQLFDYLQKAKTDISSMATSDILRKDYKPVSTSISLKIGISSVTLNAASVLQRNDFVEASEKYICNMLIDVLVLMFLSFKEESAMPIREIAIVSKEPVNQTTVCTYLLSCKNDLKLCERSDNVPAKMNNYVRLFDQDPKLSRKFVLPLLQRIHFEDH